MSRAIFASLCAAALFASASIAGQTWTFDVKTSGQNVTWTSPTAVDPAASVYAVNYTITKVLVDVTWLGIPFNNIDVTSQVPPAMQSAAFEVPGPAPVAALNQPVVIPPPPTAPAFAANLSFGLDANGFGYASAANVVLGTLAVNLGGIFGTQNVTLKAVRLIGNLTIHGAWFDLGHALAGSLGTPVLLGSGPLTSGSPLTLTLLNASPSSPTLFIVGLSTLNLPFHGGLMVPSVDLVIPLATDPTGSFSLPANWPAGIPANTSLYMQCWVLNPPGTAVDGASNALRAVAQ